MHYPANECFTNAMFLSYRQIKKENEKDSKKKKGTFKVLDFTELPMLYRSQIC